MSTKERYGTAVWNALIACEANRKDGEWGWVSVGEVMEEAGVSRGTARKYLEILRNSTHIRRIGTRSTGFFYQSYEGQ